MAAHLPVQPNSVEGVTVTPLAADGTSVEVDDGSKYLDAPNVIMFIDGMRTETVYYASKVGNILGDFTRAYDDSGISDGAGNTYGGARAWPSGTKIARYVGASDINALQTDVSAANTHVASPHAPAAAQKNSDITKSEIEAKLTGVITSHSHASSGGISFAELDGNGDVMPVTEGNGDSVFEIDVDGGIMPIEVT